MVSTSVSICGSTGSIGTQTLDVVRGSFETHEIEPSLAAFEATVPEPVGAAA